MLLSIGTGGNAGSQARSTVIRALAVTVSLAIFTIILWPKGLGSILPLLAARLRIDPAVVSGPVMSTLVDTTGMSICFTIARVILGR